MAHQKNDDFQKKIVVSFCSFLSSLISSFWEKKKEKPSIFIYKAKKIGEKIIDIFRKNG